MSLIRASALSLALFLAAPAGAQAWDFCLRDAFSALVPIRISRVEEIDEVQALAVRAEPQSLQLKASQLRSKLGARGYACDSPVDDRFVGPMRFHRVRGFRAHTLSESQRSSLSEMKRRFGEPASAPLVARADRAVEFARTPSTEYLTAEFLSQLNLKEPRRFSFVQIQGEPFLRLGDSHPLIGAGADASAAGDIQLLPHPSGRGARIGFISPRSDTYRPPNTSLPSAVEAIWSQGIETPGLQIRDWNNKDILLSLP